MSLPSFPLSSMYSTDFPRLRRSKQTPNGLTLKETLGCGAFSKVKLAVDQHGRKFALKIIDRTTASRDFLNKFLPRELSLWPKVQHANIVRMLGCFGDNDRTYSLLEYVDGCDLLHLIQQSGHFGEPQTHAYFLQLTDAVAYLHRMGIAHRDLKLENLLVDRKGNLKVCDFGFAWHHETPRRDLSRTHCGSKAYAPPEVLELRPYSPLKSDIWALGVLLFILVTGSMPFREYSNKQLVLAQQRQMELNWCGLTSTSDLRGFVLSLLTYDYVERPDIERVLAHAWLRRQQDAT